MKRFSKTNQKSPRALDAASANDFALESPKSYKKSTWTGFLVGVIVAGIALVLLWNDALPGLALNRPDIKEEEMIQVAETTVAQVSSVAKETEQEEVPVQISTISVEAEKQITKTAQKEKLVRSANDLYGNPGNSFSPSDSDLVFARESGRTDYASQQIGIVSQDLWSYDLEKEASHQITASGAIGWSGSWGSVRFSTEGKEILFYELFSKSTQTNNGPQIINSNKDGFYSASLDKPESKEKLNVPSESRILDRLEDKAFPSQANDRILFVTQDGEYIWQDENGQHSLGTAVDEKNGQQSFRYSMPTWSPDGSKIAFTRKLDLDDSEANTNVGVYILEVKENASLNDSMQVGTAYVPENHLVFEDIDIDWSPDNNSFWVGETHQLFSLSGNSFKQISLDNDLKPFSWSPDGKKVLAITQQGTRNQRFYVLSLDTITEEINTSKEELPAQIKQASWFNNEQIILRTNEGIDAYKLGDAEITKLISNTSITDFSILQNGKNIAWIAEGELWIAKVTQ